MRLRAMRKELEKFADIMFTSRPKDRAFWLGELPVRRPRVHRKALPRPETLPARFRCTSARMKPDTGTRAVCAG